mmetsp:Transcript_44455/g.107288  ORF Transcript_44455/g.107288 Transcript_44455/m.107288 type:complete len:311 (+) Transcript_44455:63-995(+)
MHPTALCDNACHLIRNFYLELCNALPRLVCGRPALLPVTFCPLEAELNHGKHQGVQDECLQSKLEPLWQSRALESAGQIIGSVDHYEGTVVALFLIQTLHASRSLRAPRKDRLNLLGPVQRPEHRTRLLGEKMLPRKPLCIHVRVEEEVPQLVHPLLLDPLGLFRRRRFPATPQTHEHRHVSGAMTHPGCRCGAVPQQLALAPSDTRGRRGRGADDGEEHEREDTRRIHPAAAGDEWRARKRAQRAAQVGVPGGPGFRHRRVHCFSKGVSEGALMATETHAWVYRGTRMVREFGCDGITDGDGQRVLHSK